MTFLGVGPTLAAVILISGVPKDEPIKAEVAALIGSWQCVFGEADGRVAPEAAIAKMKLILRADGTYRCETDDSNTSEGTFSIHQGPEAWIINLKCRTGPVPGKTLFCIYERKDNELRLCYALFGTDRPTEFSSGAGTQHILMVYKR